MNPENVEIYNRIKDLSDAAGITIAELERNVGFGNGKIGKWRNSPKSPTYESLLSIATYFETTVAYLTGETDDPSAGIKKESAPKKSELSIGQLELIELSSKMSDDELRKFIAAMKAMLGE